MARQTKIERIKELVNRHVSGSDLTSDERSFLIKNEAQADAYFQKAHAGEYRQKGTVIDNASGKIVSNSNFVPTSLFKKGKNGGVVWQGVENAKGYTPNWVNADTRIAPFIPGSPPPNPPTANTPSIPPSQNTALVPAGNIERSIGEEPVRGFRESVRPNPNAEFKTAAEARAEALRNAIPKQGFVSRMKGAVTGADGKVMEALSKAGVATGEFVKKAGGAGKVLGKAAAPALALGMEGIDLASVVGDKNTTKGDVAKQGLLSAGRLGAAAQGARMGAALGGVHPYAKAVLGLGGGIAGYLGGNALIGSVTGNPAEEVAKRKVSTQTTNVPNLSPEDQFNAEMSALDTAYRSAVKNGEDPSHIIARAKELKAAAGGLASAMQPAQQTQQTQQGQQGHPLMAIFEQALRNLQPTERRFHVPTQSFSADPYAPMQNIGEMVANHQDRVDRKRIGQETLQMLPTIAQIYGSDQTAATARSKMTYDMRKDAADRLDKFSPAYSVNDKGEQVPNHMGNQVARTIVGQEGMPLDPLEAQQRFSQGRAFGQMAANMGNVDPALRNTSMPAPAERGLHPARLADWSPIPGRNGVTLTDVWNNEPTGYVQSGRGPIAVSARAAAGGETAGGGDQLVRKGFAGMMGVR